MNDTFGEALMAYLEGGTKVHQIERDDGHINEVDTGLYFSQFNDWSPIEQEVVGYATGSVIEVGCGGGRVSKYLESQGHDVIGIDMSPLALRAARIYGASDCRFIDANEMDFPDDYFDTASLMGNGLGLTGSMESSRKMLSRLSRMVSFGGVLIASSRDPSKTDNLLHLAYHELNRKLGKPIGQVRIRVNFEGRDGEWFDLLMVEVSEVESLVKGTGWEVEKFIHSEGPLESGYGLVLRNTR
jgi:SAM-dependent methyltransferase